MRCLLANKQHRKRLGARLPETDAAEERSQDSARLGPRTPGLTKKQGFFVWTLVSFGAQSGSRTEGHYFLNLESN